MAQIMTQVSILLLTLGAASASYPSTYPFQDESLDFDYILPQVTPSFSFDESDPGGYVNLWYTCNINEFEDMFPSFSWDNDCMGTAYYYVQFSAPPVLPRQYWNCTGRETYSANMYSGQLNGERICENCCEEYYGFYVWGSEDLPNAESYWSTSIQVGGCQMMNHDDYCTFITHGYWHCMDNFIGVTERIAVLPCYVNAVPWLLGCSVYSVIGYLEITHMVFGDPAAYTDLMSISQQATALSMWNLGDRVCHPPSYYTDSGTTTSESSTSAEGTDESGGNLYSAGWGILLLFAAQVMN